MTSDVTRDFTKIALVDGVRLIVSHCEVLETGIKI